MKGEKVVLNGEQALLYVRERRSLADSSNVIRMKRQAQYINALYQTMGERMAADEQFVVDASLQMSEYIVSDRSVTQLQTLAKKLQQYEFLGIKSIEGESKIGKEFIEFYPYEEPLRDMIINLFYEQVEEESKK